MFLLSLDEEVLMMEIVIEELNYISLILNTLNQVLHSSPVPDDALIDKTHLKISANKNRFTAFNQAEASEEVVIQSNSDVLVEAFERKQR